jgi:hypothetical protein
MTIIEIVRARKEEFKADPAKADASGLLAAKAVLGGIQSPEWEDYMRQFAETTEQLMRLKGTDGTMDHPELSIRRAYLAGNGVCGGGTPKSLDFRVDTIDAAP